MLEDALAGVTLLCVIAYAVFGGADFGGGVWDMLARGPRRDEQRKAIARAMGPVWEANHVWLIFVIVLLFTAFPPAFAAVSIALFVPFHLVLVGITLRGVAFVFRAYGPQVGRTPGRLGIVFGAASAITPVLLGMSLGAIATGNVRVIEGDVRIEGHAPWLHPLALAIGAMALAVCTYVAAVYLTNETQGELREDFRARSLLAGTAVVGLSVLLLPLLYLRAPHLWQGLTSARAAPVVSAGVVASLASGWALLTRRFRLARAATIAQVAFLLVGFSLAQYPAIIYPDVTIRSAAAPEPTLRFVAWSLPIGALLTLPSLALLMAVFKGEERRKAGARGGGEY